MTAYGVGYYLNESGNSVEHFDVYFPDTIYRCRHASAGWQITPADNPVGKIPVIHFEQPKEWEGAERRIERDEMVDSKTADINEYFADPQAMATADVISGLADPETVGKLIQLQGENSRFEYVNPPTSIDMKREEKKVLKESILQDSLTPDFSYENLSGMGTLSGEALKRTLILGYIKRDSRIEIYGRAADREKNLILAIMQNVTHIPIREDLAKLKIKHEFSEPFDEDTQKKIAVINDSYSTGIMSLETAVSLLGMAPDAAEEVKRIQDAKAEDAMSPTY
jgi:SPP1 family phage portal protein